jgi:CTP synthase (UTP-ammonia lyase)
MITAIVHFDLPEPLAREKAQTLFLDSAPRYRQVQGLIRKYYLLSEDGRLKITGVDLAGQVRVIELSEHPFYVGTLYLPQLSSTHESPHPLIVAYLRAALAFGRSGKKKPLG